MIENKTGCISYNDSRFNYSYKGFCSIVCGIIDMALEHYIEYENFNIKILDQQVLELFDNISPQTDHLYDVAPLFLQKVFSETVHQQEYNAHTPANFENLKLKNKVLNNTLKIKTDLLVKFENKRKELGIDDFTLGVQIRGTDKKSELPEIKLDKVFNLIDKVPAEKIFVCTDDEKYLNPLLDRYGDKIIYDKAITISKDSQPLHHNCVNRSKINEEVLSSVYLLSKCKNFLYSFSNVSYLSLIVGSNNFKFIDHLN